MDLNQNVFIIQFHRRIYDIQETAFYTMLKRSKGGNKLGKLAYIILTLT